jgi:exodeoxyribonuclease VII small subunit
VTAEPDPSKMDYETAVAELERMVQQLGREQEDLAESVRIYERGLALARRCTQLLREAEVRLNQLVPSSDRPPSGK